MRKFWKKKYVRLSFSWIVSINVGAVSIAAIVFDIFESQQFTTYPTDELERACLAGAVIMFDIILLTQVCIFSILIFLEL